MKKTSIILLIFFYLMPVIGFSITSYYCGGKLVDISFFINDEGKCDCGSKMGQNNCCKNKTTNIKFKDTQRLLFELSIIACFQPNQSICGFTIKCCDPPGTRTQNQLLKRQLL